MYYCHTNQSLLAVLISFDPFYRTSTYRVDPSKETPLSSWFNYASMITDPLMKSFLDGHGFKEI